jgi:hypothetical protein
MPSRPVYVVPCGTRLHPKDKYFSGLKAPAKYLGYRKDRDLSDTMHVTWRADFIHELLQKAFWVCCLTSGMFLLIS